MPVAELDVDGDELKILKLDKTETWTKLSLAVNDTNFERKSIGQFEGPLPCRSR